MQLGQSEEGLRGLCRVDWTKHGESLFERGARILHRLLAPTDAGQSMPGAGCLGVLTSLEAGLRNGPVTLLGQAIVAAQGRRRAQPEQGPRSPCIVVSRAAEQIYCRAKVLNSLGRRRGGERMIGGVKCVCHTSLDIASANEVKGQFGQPSCRFLIRLALQPFADRLM